jgi:hypothetical protein
MADLTVDYRTQTQLAVDAYRAGNVNAALRIARRFRLGLTVEERRQLVRGYECLINPGFYRQLGFDPGVELAKATVIFEQKIERGA